MSDGSIPSQRLPKGEFHIRTFRPKVISSWLGLFGARIYMNRVPTTRFDRNRPPTRAKWDHALGRRLIFLSDGRPKYEQRYGVPLSRVLLACWIRKGHIRRVGLLNGRNSILVEADLAYCAEVHAWRTAVRMPQSVPLLDKDGSPAVPSYLSPAEAVREYRRRKALGISLRPRKKKHAAKPKGR